jgi:hypothetical protein
MTDEKRGWDLAKALVQLALTAQRANEQETEQVPAARERPAGVSEEVWRLAQLSLTATADPAKKPIHRR